MGLVLEGGGGGHATTTQGKLDLRQMHEFVPENELPVCNREIPEKYLIAARKRDHSHRSRRPVRERVVVHGETSRQLRPKGRQPPLGVARKVLSTVVAPGLHEQRSGLGHDRVGWLASTHFPRPRPRV